MTIEMEVNQPNLALTHIEELIISASRQAQVNIDQYSWSTNKQHGHVIRLDCDSECDERLIRNIAGLAIFRKMSDEITYRELVPHKGFVEVSSPY